VQNAGTGTAQMSLTYYDGEGVELDRVTDTVPRDSARAVVPRPATADATSIVVRSAGSPVVAALLQSPGD
jgi:hypothetical protein